MRREITSFLIVLLLLNINYVIGQDIFQKLNELPATIEVRAPEFNTEKKYFFKINTDKNILIIQDLRTSKDGKVHFYQFLYEIPLNQLNSESFKVSNSDNEISLEIGSERNENAILFYMFQDNKVSSISSANGIPLGNWTYSDSLYNEITQIIKSISDALPKSDPSLKAPKKVSGKFKYIADNVTHDNAEMDDDLSIGKDYYFEQIINPNGSFLYPKLLKTIKRALKEQNISYTYPLPVIIYANHEGVIESIFIGNVPADKYCTIDLTKLEPIKIGTKNDRSTKYLFLLE